ncbi:MAG: hypothetical protein EA398_10295 [Deltaproteobacteria bacterium]|nr:MAG: hypothetical protein EA398_10295 [Deltaproteobacteria bacterium]
MLDLSTLNPPQRQAVTHREGPMLVLAGAGSGKTRVITCRIAWLIEQGIRAEHILAVSFTNKAAGEMRERVGGLLGRTVSRQVHLSTFHALGATMLREDIEALGYQRPFVILDEADRFRIIRDILRELRVGGTRKTEARILAIISRAKNALCSPAELPEARYNPEMPRAQRVHTLYGQALRNLNAVDFDDLLLLPVQLMRQRPDLREKYRQRFRYVMVDEYQDTNAIQLALLEELVQRERANLVVVGDDDQSIYAFRGAVAGTILEFDQRFPGARVVTLDQNYRSVGTILRAANAVISHNDQRREKNLWSTLGAGDPIPSLEFPTDAEEAEWIVDRIRRVAERDARPWRHFAILYRINPQSRILEEVLRSQRVPYRIIGGQSLFDRKEVKDLLAWLRLVLNPRDELSLRRVINVPPRGIGTTTLAALDQRAREDGLPLLDAVRAALRDGSLPERAREGATQVVQALDEARYALREAAADGLEDILDTFLMRVSLEKAILQGDRNEKIARIRWSIVQDLIGDLGRIDAPDARARLDRFVTDVSLDPRTDGGEEDADADAVTMLTIHSSKGLEFPLVFLCGMSEGLLPHQRAIDEHAVPEERRLCYVGMTRAQERLVLTRARATRRRNERIALRPSRFLDEIPPDLRIDRIVDSVGASQAERAERTSRGLAEALARLDAIDPDAS